MKQLLRKQILFFGGKGGVGKTTISSAFSLRAAMEGKKTLLVSTDPAHNLQDIFDKNIGQEPTKLTSNLWGMEINPESESKRYINSVKENLSKVVQGQLMHEIDRQIDIASVSPGADESAMFDRMVEIIEWVQHDFDLIIFDTAPTGHTLRLLSLPELMGVWVDGMLQRRQKIMKTRETWLEDAQPAEDPIYEILTRRKLKFSRAKETLLNPKITGFSFVLIPERLPIMETAKALPVLSKHKIPVDTLILNRILPESADGQFLMRRREQEKKYLKEIEDRFHAYKVKKIYMQDQDICGMDALHSIANALL